MTAIPKTKMSLEEYFELDKNAEGNFEYFNGEIFEMSGVSPNHATIEMNLAEMVNPKARKKDCRAFPANLRVKVPMLPTYRYPDLSVVCGKAEFVEIGGLQCLANPILIVEVLSDSTEKHDQGEKFREYKSIESFNEYLLISSTEKVVVLYQKHNEKFWLRSDYVTGESFHLNSLDFDVSVDEIYQGVEFS
jgi:Uma2 family endonuclease